MARLIPNTEQAKRAHTSEPYPNQEFQMDSKSLAAVITEKRRIEIREFAVPSAKADDAVLKVEACGICGSDYHYYKEVNHWPYLNPPHIMGHEVVGRIAGIGV